MLLEVSPFPSFQSRHLCHLAGKMLHLQSQRPATGFYNSMALYSTAHLASAFVCRDLIQPSCLWAQHSGCSHVNPLLCLSYW